MSHGIQKKTYVEADEKTTKALTFDMLDNLHDAVNSIRRCHEEHLARCDGRFIKLENKDKRNNLIATGIGGALVVGFQWVRELFK